MSLESDVSRLIEICGSGQLAMQMLQESILNCQKEFPEIPAKVWEEYSKEVSVEELNNLFVQFYTKYFSHEEIVQLIDFYQSQIGQKLIGNQFVREILSIGQQWSQKLNDKLIKYLEKHDEEIIFNAENAQA